MSEAPTLPTVTDRAPFSLHPEDWVTQQDSHDEQCIYFKQSLRLLLPACFVAHDLAVYWVPGQMQDPYVGPDVFISRNKPKVEDPKVWLTYEDGPLALVIEVASDATRSKEEGKRDEIYAGPLQVPEYLFFDRYREVLRLERLVEGRYVPIEPDARGILWSREFGVGFVWPAEEHLVRVVSPQGEIVPTRQEEAALRREEAARRREAEQRAAGEERRAAREARRAREEAQLRAAAEQRAQEEARQRAAAEQRAGEMAAEIERLQRLLDDRAGSAPEDGGEKP